MPDFAPPGLEPDIAGQPGPGRRGAGGGPHLDHRGRAAARRRPLHLRGLPPARPPRRPRLSRRLLLPQQRRGGGADPLRGRPEAGRHRRPRPPLPERHLGAGRADGGGRHPALAARLAGHQRRRAHGAAAEPARTGRRLRRQPRRRRLPGARSRASVDDLDARPRGAGRLARLRHGRGRPARRLELRAGDLRRDRPPAGPSPGCRSA